jgi:hypothetical protein
MKDIKSPLLEFLAFNIDLVEMTCDTLGMYEFFPAGWATTGAMSMICGTIPAICEFGAYIIIDEDVRLDDRDRL